MTTKTTTSTTENKVEMSASMAGLRVAILLLEDAIGRADVGHNNDCSEEDCPVEGGTKILRDLCEALEKVLAHMAFDALQAMADSSSTRH